MAANNFLQFNPSQANQETDVQYAADATRTGGAGVDAIWPSPSANKTLYQVSIGVAALMQAMANKGFTMSDSNFGALVAQLANIRTTADGKAQLQTVAWASNVTLDASQFSGFQITLQGNTTISITGQTVGDLITIIYIQDGAGGHLAGVNNAYGNMMPSLVPYDKSAQTFKVESDLMLVATGALISNYGINAVDVGDVIPAHGTFADLTCPTRSAGDSTMKAATTAFVQNAVANSIQEFIGQDGYVKLDSLIIKWGLISVVGGNSGSVFNYSGAHGGAFPFATFGILITDNTGTNMNNQDRVSAVPSGTGGFVAYSTNNTITCFWIAVGY